MCVFPIYAHQACELLIIISKYNNIICQWMASSHIRNSHLGSYRASIQPSPHTHTPNRIWFAFGTISNVSFDAKQHIHLSNVWFFCIHLDQMTHRRIISSVWSFVHISFKLEHLLSFLRIGCAEPSLFLSAYVRVACWHFQSIQNI